MRTKITYQIIFIEREREKRENSVKHMFINNKNKK